MNKKLAGILLLALVAVIGVIAVVAQQGKSESVLVEQSKKQNAEKEDSVVSIVEKAGTEGWKTYRSEKYGFEFEYPRDFKIKEESFEKEGGPGGIVYDIYFVGKGISVTINEIQEGYRNGDDPLSEPNGMDPASQKDTPIAGLKGRIYNDDEVYVVAKNGYQYHLSRDIETGEQSRELLAKIVSTFKFTK